MQKPSEQQIEDGFDDLLIIVWTLIAIVCLLAGGVVGYIVGRVYG